MPKSIIEYLIGDLKDKRKYRQMTKRVNALPKDYRFAFKKMKQYMYNYGSDATSMDMLIGLVDLFEESAINGQSVLDLVGDDVALFCDELIKATTNNELVSREKLNLEIKEYFREKENRNGKAH